MVFLEDVEDSHHNLMMLFFGLATKDEDVINIDGHNSLLKYFQSFSFQSQHPFQFTDLFFYVDIYSQSTGVAQ